MHIEDLHFQKEILPLFDFVHNEFSRDSLVELLTDFPRSAEEVLERQQIIQNLMRNDGLNPIGNGSPAPAGNGSSQPLSSYGRSEFSEVYGYLENMRNRSTGLSGPSLKIRWLFARSEKHRERGKLTQLVLFFFRIDSSWFSHVREEQFPTTFGRQIKNCKQFLSELEVVKYQALARGRVLGIGEMAALLQFLTEKIRQGGMDIFWKDFFRFEAWLSIARGILKHRFVFPEFGNGRLALDQFYHPLVKDPVKNDLLALERVNLITGPNMSGKSTLLKAIGICVVLAHLGLAVPADRCELPFFEVISISINLNDDLQSGYSHFMAEIQSLKKVVIAAGDGKACFAVFDELFRGTNAEDALAISATTIRGLAKFPDSYFFISTHLHQLKERLLPAAPTGHSAPTAHSSPIPLPCPIGTHYIECRIDDGRPIFTYVLRRGWSDLKIGQLLFDREGLSDLLAEG